jgi:hypothetical protein
MKIKKLKSLENKINIDLLRCIVPYLYVTDRINLKKTSIYYKNFFDINKLYNNINLTYVIDTTASIIYHYDIIMENISKINIFLNNLKTTFSIIEFSDHENGLLNDNENDYNNEYPVKIHNNINNGFECNHIISNINLDNGGDIPEAIADAFYAVNTLKFSNDDINIVIFICDSFPHGENYPDDFFPHGCPCGKNYINEYNKFIQKNIKFINFPLNNYENDYEKYINIFKSKLQKYKNYIELNEYINIKKYILNLI